MAPFPAWPLKSSEVSRGRLASPGPSLHRAQNKQHRSRTRTWAGQRLASGGCGTHACPARPLSSFTSTQPLLSACTVGGAQTATPFCLAAAGQADADVGSPPTHSRAARKEHWRPLLTGQGPSRPRPSILLSSVPTAGLTDTGVRGCWASERVDRAHGERRGEMQLRTLLPVRGRLGVRCRTLQGQGSNFTWPRRVDEGTDVSDREYGN